LSKRLLAIEHTPQEVDAGCLAACCQMLLARLGISVSQEELELNQLFELTPLGVPLSRLTRLEPYGVQVAIQKDGDWDALRQAIDQDLPSIVFVRTQQLSYWIQDTQHVLLVSGYDDPNVLLHDPAFSNAPQRVLADELMLVWDEFDNVYAHIVLPSS
jgi:ABC-type bacteriocin/lantibiotic exporter with double-glycine peptidase domain